MCSLAVYIILGASFTECYTHVVAFLCFLDNPKENSFQAQNTAAKPARDQATQHAPQQQVSFYQVKWMHVYFTVPKKASHYFNYKAAN